MKIDFWFEFASTYSYPAAMRIEALATARGIAVAWRPFLLGPIFRDQGWDDSPFNLFPSKGRYMWRDMERLCSAHDIPFRRPSVFPRNGLLAARVACRYAQEAWLPDFVRAVYSANFAQDLDISTMETVRSCLDASGVDADDILREAQSVEAKVQLRQATEAASRLGIFGAPMFSVGGELFWGNDRLEDAICWAVNDAARQVDEPDP